MTTRYVSGKLGVAYVHELYPGQTNQGCVYCLFLKEVEEAEMVVTASEPFGNFPGVSLHYMQPSSALELTRCASSKRLLAAAIHRKVAIYDIVAAASVPVSFGQS